MTYIVDEILKKILTGGSSEKITLNTTYFLFFLMLKEKELKRINELLKKGESNYQIGNKLGHSPNTINKYREEYNEEKDHVKGEVGHFDSSKDGMLDPISYFESYLKHKKLKKEERENWETCLEQWREIKKSEVDERLPKEIETAVKENDEEWDIKLQKDYVHKQIVSNLNIKNDKLNDYISRLITSNKNKDELLFRKQSVIFQLKDDKQLMEEILRKQIYDLSWENNDLKCENSRQRNKMKDFDYHVERQMETLDNKIEISNIKEIKFKKDTEVKQQEFNKLTCELDKNIESIKIREKNISMREAAFNEKIKRTNDGFDKTQRRIKHDQEQIDMDRADIEKNREQDKIESQQLVKWQTILNETGGFNKFSLPCKNCKRSMFFDATDPETFQKLTKIFGDTHPECRLKNEQPLHVTLKLVSYSGEPIFQSGFSPVIQSGEQVMSVVSSGEPVMHSGCYI